MPITGTDIYISGSHAPILMGGGTGDPAVFMRCSGQFVFFQAVFGSCKLKGTLNCEN